MRVVATIVCIIGSVMANTLPRLIPHIPSVEYGNLFCKWQAVSFSLMAIGASISSSSRYLTILWQWVALLTLNSTYNEIIGDPFGFTWIEKSFVICITLWTIFRITKCRTNI